MKFLPRFVVISIVLLAAFLSSGNDGRAQVALTVSPAMISNTYPGFITLNITGLTNTEQVTIQRWLDANSNSVIDANEPMLEAFKIKDGGVTVIGGITNVSVPYDSNSATSAITTTLAFGPPLVFMNTVGQQIFRVVSPTGRFTPVTATLTVTNALLSQSVNGVVYSNGVAGLPNAIVVALAMPNQNYAGATVADPAGNYHLALPAGQYGLIGLYPGYYTDQNLAPFFTLTNGVNVTNNISATNSTGPVISGQVYDAISTNALGGVMLQFSQSGGSLFTIAFTDTNGNFSAPVTSNNWKIKIDSLQLAHRAYLVPENTALSVSTALGNVTNANIGLFRGNALYYGHFTDNLGNPLVNYDIIANDIANQFKADGLTDANGNYGVAVLNTTNTPWFVGPAGNNIALANVIINSQQNAISNNIFTTLNDFYTLPVTAQITGRLTDNAGHPLSQISMFANMSIGATNFTTDFVDTDTNGNYSLGAANGTWDVMANQSGGHSLAGAGYYDPSPNHYVTIPPTNPVVNLVVYPANLPQFGQPMQVTTSQFNLNLYGAANDNYTVQVSTNLANTNWLTLTVISNLPSSPYLIQDFQATNSARFYRAFEGP